MLFKITLYFFFKYYLIKKAFASTFESSSEIMAGHRPKRLLRRSSNKLNNIFLEIIKKINSVKIVSYVKDNL